MNIATKTGLARLLKTSRRKKALTVVAGLAVLVAGSSYVLTANGLSTSSNPGQAAASDQAQDADISDGSTPGASTATPGSAAAPSASPTPIRTAGRTPAARPPSGNGAIPIGWPTPSTTGWRHTGATLKPYGGSGEEIVITKSGTIIDSVDIRSRVRILANNVTIKRSRIMATSCSSSQGCYVLSIAKGYYGLLVEDVEVTRAPGAKGMDRAIVLAEDGGSRTKKRAIVRRVYVHDTYRGILVGDNTVIEDSYIDDQDRNRVSEVSRSLK